MTPILEAVRRGDLAEATKLYTRLEVSIRLRCSLKSVDTYVNQGKLKSTPMGRKRLFTEAQIVDFITRQSKRG